MVCKIREWKVDDAEELSGLLNNKSILDNLRDGLPFPYTQDDAKILFNLCLIATKTAFLRLQSSIAVSWSAVSEYSDKRIFILELQSLATT